MGGAIKDLNMFSSKLQLEDGRIATDMSLQMGTFASEISETSEFWS